MNYATRTIVVCALVATVSGCVTTNQPGAQKSQLEVREFQTRVFDTKDQRAVMRAFLSALQDDGFIVNQANTDLGLLTAQKEVNIRDEGAARVLTFLSGSKAVYRNNAILEVTANVTPFGNKVRARFNIQQKILDNKNSVMDARPIDDPKIYQDFFATVDKSIFIENQKL